MTAPRSARLDAEVPNRHRHLEFATAQYSDPRVARWHWPEPTGGPRSREQVLDILDRQAAQQREVGFSLWWWRERVSGRLVGTVGLNRDRIDGEPVVEVGWSINPECWRCGFATEAAVASIAFGFEVARLSRIVSFTLHDNVASRGVMEHAGLEYERDFERKGFRQVLYATDRSSWRTPGAQ